MRIGPSLALAFAAACALSGPFASATHAQTAATSMYYVKKGVTPARYDADLAACLAAAKKNYEAELAKVRVGYQPGLAGAAVSGFAQGVERSRLKREGIAATWTCMERNGYRKVPMTKANLEIVSRLNSEQRAKAAGILAGGGNLSRLLSN